MTNYVVIDQSKPLNIFGSITNDSNTDLSSSPRPDEGDNFPCGYCQKTFQTFPQMVNHIQNNHYQLDFDTNFTRPETNSGSTIGQVVIDSSNNQPTSNPVISGWTNTCHPCGMEFENEIDLENHLETHHYQSSQKKNLSSETISDQLNGIKKSKEHSVSYVCETCNKCFLNKSSLSEHRWVHSKEILPWRCDHCDKLFPYQSRLEKHQLTHIDKSKRKIKYKCSVCDKTFFRKNDLWSHEKAKGHRQPSQSGNFTLAGNLKVRSVHKRGYECVDCGKILANSGSMFNHRQSLHHGGDSQKRFACPECDCRFALKQKMVTHIKRSHLTK